MGDSKCERSTESCHVPSQDSGQHDWLEAAGQQGDIAMGWGKGGYGLR
jgi:hypothetical protein